MRILNLGILAHVDAGKTSLTERLLHDAGVIERIGSVDAGDTTTDTLALERQRGITIKSAVVSFVSGADGPDPVTINLIDTPGHPDFIAEVERVLAVLDGAVLVVSAVEGVQPQTRILFRTLQRLGIPTLLFVNKLDRSGADPERVTREIGVRLSESIVAMGSADPRALGTRAARFQAYGPSDPAHVERLANVLAGNDDELLETLVDGPPMPYARLRAQLRAQVARAATYPVFAGSAITGAGVPELTRGIRKLLPGKEFDADGPTSGLVFKIERGPSGERIAYARMFAGTVRVRERVQVSGTDAAQPESQPEYARITGIDVFADGTRRGSNSLPAGHIGALHGLAKVRIGDVLGTPPPGLDRAVPAFAPPSLETVIVPKRQADKGRLHVALDQLAEQDPLIGLRQDDVRQEIYLSLYGEVQKEVVQATLANDFGLEVGFRETSMICVERLAGSGSSYQLIKQGENPFLATVGLRVDPAPIGAGVTFRLEVELGSMPPAFFTAVEESVRNSLQQGIYGWSVPDVVVTMTRSGYWARQSRPHQGFSRTSSSTAEDFRFLTPLVLMDALREPGTLVCEPMHAFRLEVPGDVLGTLLPVLAKLDAIPGDSDLRGSAYVLEGIVPAARIHDLRQQVPGLTRGEGVLETAFDHYRPVQGEPPTRPRTDENPLQREEYLRRLARRAGLA